MTEPVAPPIGRFTPSTMDDRRPITRVGIVGGGVMGVGIAEVCARAGLDVQLVEVNGDAALQARERLAASLERAVNRGKLDQSSMDSALSITRFEDSLEAFADRELVIEAITENAAIKLETFRRLARTMTARDCILASNTSSIPIVELAAATEDRAERVVGLHFFNPVPVLDLVEIIPSLLTAPDVVTRVRAFVTDQLGKEPIDAPDRAGFTVNALLIPYLLAAIRMFDQGLASAKDIDCGMVKGCAHPMGPLALADLIGLDTVLSVAETLYAEHREPLYAPPPMLKRLVSAGLLGRKTARGLYSYADDSLSE